MTRHDEGWGTETSPGGGRDWSRLDSLAARARVGDRQALAELWEAAQPVVAPALRRYTFRREEGPLEAADLRQQGFIILAETVACWQGQGPFVAWLRRLFPLGLVRYRRSLLNWDGPQVESLGYEDLVALVESQAHATPSEDPCDAVLCRQLLAALPAAYRRLLVWRFAHGLPYREIERLAGIPATTAQARCAQALAYLRAKAAGVAPPPLPGVRARPPGHGRDLAGAVRALWLLARTGGGLLPPAPEAAAALGMGRRAYDDLLARLAAAGCLGRAAVSFASRQGRRRRVVVDVEEALRRLSLAQAG